jgi:hypothetical protein
MKNVKIRLLTDRGTYVWLKVNYFPKRCGGGVDNFYLTDHACWATAVPLKEARRWMREAKCLAATDGDVNQKSEYVCGGKPTTLSALGLKRNKK